ncbi:cytosine-purine permease [Collybia nuda]|uniref:Cytosine-purine permease n=1 Tax=Collybia nuda TaxID=64659 RepID=A0A9P6CGX8_9AGAR|nr:cytosine-purine permease [Collybia nuda]
MEAPSPARISNSTKATTHLEPTLFQKITTFLSQWGIETHGISPIAKEGRVDNRLYQMFFVWFSANFNILTFGTGSAGPAFFGLGLRDTLIILVIVDAISCIIPAIFGIFGPKLGTRAMVQARFSWGYYGALIPSILNVLSTQGFVILNCIIGGQTLAGVSHHLNATLGIVIISVISMVVCFFGYKVVHWYESVAWTPNVVAFITILAIGGKHLQSSEIPTPPPPSASTVISFATFIASSVISWCTMVPDYGVYHNAKASSVRIFVYTYLGFFMASITGHMLGAAFAAASPAVPSWSDGFGNGNNVGGLFAAILLPVGGFGKFLLVLVALSVPAACAPTMYTFGTSFMAIAPIFAKVPRYLFIIVSEAILVPVAIVGATRFYTVLVNILSVIGYWSIVFSGIILTEHFVFRRHKFSNYHTEDWDNAKLLPTGFAAVFAFFGAFGIIVPSMSQTWYIGPIANAGTGDIGIITGFIVAIGLYILLRGIELWVFPGGKGATGVFNTTRMQDIGLSEIDSEGKVGTLET